MSTRRPVIHAAASPAPLVVAHRGAPAHGPENTLASFEAALALGAEAVELDVRISKDGAAVVFHDAHVDRVTGGTGQVAERSLAELRRLRVHETERIPTLIEALDRLRGRSEVFIDLKPSPHLGPARLARAVLDAAAHAGTPLPELVLVCEDDRPLRAAQSRQPSLRLVPHHRASRRRPPAGTWALSVEDTGRAEAVVARARPARALVWTVNDVARMRDLAAAGADAIVTDRPDLLRACLDSIRRAA